MVKSRAEDVLLSSSEAAPGLTSAMTTVPRIKSLLFSTLLLEPYKFPQSTTNKLISAHPFALNRA